jgi:CRISPR-associated protein Cmx8
MSNETLVLSYDVYTLPTAQHRAGLAGLLLLCDLLGNEGVPLPTIETSEPGIYRFTCTPDSIRSVLNYFYDAEMVEVPVKSKWAGQEPKRLETRLVTGGKEEKIFIYDQLTPKALFFRKMGMPDIWIRLWFSALWQTLRAVPKTRIPYENRNTGKDALDITVLWKDLENFQKDFIRGKLRTSDVPGCFFVGSQAHNAEMVSFKGRLDENLLLHFWPVVMGIYQPEVIKVDGSTPLQGYVLVIPDVLDVESFCTDFKHAMQQLDPAVSGYRPRGSIISVHQEGALAYGYQLMGIARSQQAALNRYSVCGIEAYHLEKRGNNVHMLASDRVEIDEKTLRAYDNIRAQAWNPLFKRQRILNLLSGKPWYQGFERVLSIQSKDLFFGKSRPALSFAGDVGRKFKELKGIEQVARSVK